MFRFKRRWSIVPVAGALGLMVTAAFAFFLTTYIGDGSHEGKTGKGSAQSLGLNISFQEGLTPEHPVAIFTELENTTGKAQTFKTFPMKVETPTVPKCGKEWLILKGEGTTSTGTTWNEIIHGTNTKPLPAIPAGNANVISQGGTVTLEFDPAKASVDETSCENVPVVVSGHLE